MSDHAATTSPHKFTSEQDIASLLREHQVSGLFADAADLIELLVRGASHAKELIDSAVEVERAFGTYVNQDFITASIVLKDALRQTTVQARSVSVSSSRDAVCVPEDNA